MLLKIPKILTPELLKRMCEMGHGSEIVLADANFPACDCVAPEKILFLPSVRNAELLEAVLQFFPLDSYGANLVLMQPDPGWDIPEVWESYDRIARGAQPDTYQAEKIGRQDFYRRAQRAHVVVVTGEQAPYANILLVKGVIQ